MCVLSVLTFDLTHAIDDDLETLRVPVFREKQGYGLAVTQYALETEADLFDGDAPEHTAELSALLQAPSGEDVLCFASTLVVNHANNREGKDLLVPQRGKRKGQKFFALIPHPDYKTREGKPMALCETELDDMSLTRPGSEVHELIVTATAVVVKQRESEEVAAEVADRFTEIGSGTSVQVSSIEVDKKGEMTVQLSVRHKGNKDLPVIDSVYALNRRSEVLGGGRWDNELELFGKTYEVELAFPLRGDEKSIDKLRIVLATEYELKNIEFTLKDLLGQ